jgi:hypothetical protein
MIQPLIGGGEGANTMNHTSRVAIFTLALGILLASALVFVVSKVIARGTADMYIDIDNSVVAPQDFPLDEYIRIKNATSQSVVMTGWTLADQIGNIYTFPTFFLGAGNSVKVWTKLGIDNISNLYWGRTEPVWDDTSDCAYLRDGSGIEGNLIDSLCYPALEPPSVQFALPDYSANEAATTTNISVTLSAAASITVTVDYQTTDGTATGGSDYVSVSDTLTFTVGETSKTFDITILDDAAQESSETVTMILSNPSGAVLGTPSTAVLTILDNDQPEPSPTFTNTPSPTATSTSTNTPTPTATSTQTPTNTSTATSTSTSTPTATSTPTPTEIPGKLAYAPIMARSVPPTPTPTPTAPVTSTPTPTSTPVPAICNGDFEQGRTCWLEVSTNGFNLVTNNFEGIINAHSGSWGAWLGGYYYETSAIYQQITVPTGSPRLSYWYWIGSTDFCGYDVGGVVINEDAVDGYWLCSSTNTGGWVQRTIDLSTYAGQSVTLYFLADTDGTFNSSLFIDDVQIQR